MSEKQKKKGLSEIYGEFETYTIHLISSMNTIN